MITGANNDVKIIFDLHNTVCARENPKSEICYSTHIYTSASALNRYDIMYIEKRFIFSINGIVNLVFQVKTRVLRTPARRKVDFGKKSRLTNPIRPVKYIQSYGIGILYTRV